MASVEEITGGSGDLSCFFVRELPYKIDSNGIDPKVAEADDRALERMNRFSLGDRTVKPNRDNGNPEAAGAQLKADLQELGVPWVASDQLPGKRTGFLHPLAEGLHRIGNWLRGFQHRRFPSTAT